jgi:hypothetical protein
LQELIALNKKKGSKAQEQLRLPEPLASSGLTRSQNWQEQESKQCKCRLHLALKNTEGMLTGMDFSERSLLAGKPFEDIPSPLF